MLQNDLQMTLKAKLREEAEYGEKGRRQQGERGEDDV
jgi:hypothetical protein